MLAITFAIAIVLGISMIWFKNEGIFAFFTYLILIPTICISFAAKPIFNLFLQLSSKNKLLITSSSSVQSIIFGNYIASLVIAIVSSAYLFSCLVMASNDKSALSIVSCILGVITGIFISTATFLPVLNRQKSRSLALIYQLVVGGLGIINIAICLSTNQMGSLYSVFFWLVISSPVFAFWTSKYSHP